MHHHKFSAVWFALIWTLVVSSSVLQQARADGVQTGGATADGIAAYYVILHAGKIGANGNDELSRQRPVPSGPLAHHLMVVLFDAANLQRIEAQRVIATISKSLEPEERRELTPHTMGGFKMFGNYFTLKTRHRYHVHMDVELPGSEKVAKLDFDFMLE
jgi:hypothetical protein